MTVNDVAGLAWRAAESAVTTAGLTYAFQMSTGEAGLALTVLTSAAGLIWFAGKMVAGQRAIVGALQRIDRRTARLEKHAGLADEAEPIERDLSGFLA